MPSLLSLPFLAAPALLVSAGGPEPPHPHHAHGDGLHFRHPLVTESPSPDTKLRVDGEFLDLDEGTQHLARVEGEVAFDRSFSVEVAVPYAFLDPDGPGSSSHLGAVEIALKFASFAYEEHGLLLSYGLEVGLPTGDDQEGIASDHLLELEPFLGFGYQLDGYEVVGRTSFGIPINQGEGEDVETELGFELSCLRPVGSRLEALLELDGDTVLSGAERGASSLFLSPGAKVVLGDARRLKLGLSVGFPVVDDHESDLRVLASLFYHL